MLPPIKKDCAEQEKHTDNFSEFITKHSLGANGIDCEIQSK
jgi:hypothetical protein